MFHADNAYFLPELVISSGLKTNTVSNTAFRGFGGPQGMLAMERVIDAVAWHTGQDPLDVRNANLYGEGRDLTPYGMQVEDHDVARDHEGVGRQQRLPDRRQNIRIQPEIADPQARPRADTGEVRNLVHARPISTRPARWFMSTRTARSTSTMAAPRWGRGCSRRSRRWSPRNSAIGMDRVRITATVTDKVPNTAPTAASSGSDLNGMAAQIAARRSGTGWRRSRPGCSRSRPTGSSSATTGCSRAMRASASANLQRGHTWPGFNCRRPASTRRRRWSGTRRGRRGRPFYYFAYGAACSEVVVDTMTGESKVLRVDILHDVGRSLNPALDIGQIEGGFVQGMGWLTTEELVYDKEGRLRTHAPSTYKIPVASDVPADFRVASSTGRTGRT